MAKNIFMFKITQKTNTSLVKFFLEKPSVEDLADCCKHFNSNLAVDNVLHKLIVDGLVVLDNSPIKLTLEEISLIDNTKPKKLRGMGVRLITEFSFDDEVDGIPNDEFEEFLSKLSEENCEVFFSDDETNFKFNHINEKDFLDFYHKYKKGEVKEDFKFDEQIMIERIYTLITKDKPSYLKHSGYVRFL